jgi:hypothetical protein
MRKLLFYVYSPIMLLGLAVGLSTIFTLQKLVGALAWTWWVVLSPVWGVPVCM